jgi:hypothetical protein
MVFPHPDFEDLRSAKGLLADVQNPKKNRYSFLLELETDSDHSPELAITTNNNQANWDRLAELIGRIDHGQPIDVWYFDIWFFGLPHEIWHLEQNGKVILDFDRKDYEYRVTRSLLGAIGSVLLLVSGLLFYRRSRRKPTPGD